MSKPNRPMKSILEYLPVSLDKVAVACPFNQRDFRDQISSLFQRHATETNIKQLLNKSMSKIADGVDRVPYHNNRGLISLEEYAKRKMSKVCSVPFSNTSTQPANETSTLSEGKKRGLEYCADMVIAEFGKVQLKVGSTGDITRCWGSGYTPLFLQSYGTVFPIPLDDNEMGQAEFFVMVYMIKKGLSINQIPESRGSTQSLKYGRVGFIYVVPTLFQSTYHHFVEEARYKHRALLVNVRALRAAPVEAAPTGCSFLPIGAGIGEGSDAEEEDEENNVATMAKVDCSNTQTPSGKESDAPTTVDFGSIKRIVSPFDDVLQQLQSPQSSQQKDDARAKLFEAMEVKTRVETTKTHVETKLLLNCEMDTVREKKSEKKKAFAAHCGSRDEAKKRVKSFDTRKKSREAARKKARMESSDSDSSSDSNDDYDEEESQNSTCNFILRMTARKKELKAQLDKLGNNCTAKNSKK